MEINNDTFKDIVTKMNELYTMFINLTNNENEEEKKKKIQSLITQLNEIKERYENISQKQERIRLVLKDITDSFSDLVAYWKDSEIITDYKDMKSWKNMDGRIIETITFVKDKTIFKLELELKEEKIIE